MTIDDIANARLNYERLPFSKEFQDAFKTKLEEDENGKSNLAMLAYSKAAIAKNLAQDGYPRHAVFAAFSGFETALKSFIVDYTQLSESEAGKMGIMEKVRLFERTVASMGYSTIQFERLKQNLLIAQPDLSGINQLDQFSGQTVYKLRNQIAHGDEVDEKVLQFVNYAIQACVEAVSYITDKGWEKMAEQALYTDVLASQRESAWSSLSAQSSKSVGAQLGRMRRYIDPDELGLLERIQPNKLPWIEAARLAF